MSVQSVGSIVRFNTVANPVASAASLQPWPGMAPDAYTPSALQPAMPQWPVMPLQQPQGPYPANLFPAQAPLVSNGPMVQPMIQPVSSPIPA